MKKIWYILCQEVITFRLCLIGSRLNVLNVEIAVKHAGERSAQAECMERSELQGKQFRLQEKSRILGEKITKIEEDQKFVPL